MSGSQAPRYPTIFPLGMGLCQFWQISSLKAGTKMLKVAAFAMPCWDAAGRPVVFLLGGTLGSSSCLYMFTPCVFYPKNRNMYYPAKRTTVCVYIYMYIIYIYASLSLSVFVFRVFISWVSKNPLSISFSVPQIWEYSDSFIAEGLRLKLLSARVKVTSSGSSFHAILAASCRSSTCFSMQKNPPTHTHIIYIYI